MHWLTVFKLWLYSHDIPEFWASMEVFIPIFHPPRHSFNWWRIHIVGPLCFPLVLMSSVLKPHWIFSIFTLYIWTTLKMPDNFGLWTLSASLWVCWPGCSCSNCFKMIFWLSLFHDWETFVISNRDYPLADDSFLLIILSEAVGLPLYTFHDFYYEVIEDHFLIKTFFGLIYDNCREAKKSASNKPKKTTVLIFTLLEINQ